MTFVIPQTLPLYVALQQAIAYHQAGRLHEAEQLYRAILQAQPTHSDANHNFGVLAMQVGQPTIGLSHFRAALEADPNQSQYWLSYIDALIRTDQSDAAGQIMEQGRRQGLKGDAFDALTVRLSEKYPSAQENAALIAHFTAGQYTDAAIVAKAITVRLPTLGFGWRELGAALSLDGLFADALIPLQKAAALLPGDAQAHNNLGNALLNLGQFDAAAASCRRALELKPDYADGYNNLGNALKELGQLDDAVASYRRAIALKPDCAGMYNNLGIVLKESGQPDSAIENYRRALELQPDYAEAYNNLSTVLLDIGQFDQAAANCRRALALKPEYADAYNNLGNALKELGQLDGAVASYRRALGFNSTHAVAYNNLGNALKDLGQLDDAAAAYRRALELRPGFFVARSNLLFTYNLMPDQSAAMLLAEALHFGDLAAWQARPFSDWPNIAEIGRCLRIGLVSGDLYNHPVGHFAEGVLAELAENACGRLEFMIYSNQVRSDVLSERIKACCHGWHSAVGLSDENLAQLIRNDSIDILIDLSGHTALNRLPMFAWKPAPIQVGWLGYYSTTGVRAVDYLFADAWLSITHNF